MLKLIDYLLELLLYILTLYILNINNYIHFKILSLLTKIKRNETFNYLFNILYMMLITETFQLNMKHLQNL